MSRRIGGVGVESIRISLSALASLRPTGQVVALRDVLGWRVVERDEELKRVECQGLAGRVDAAGQPQQGEPGRLNPHRLIDQRRRIRASRQVDPPRPPIHSVGYLLAQQLSDRRIGTEFGTAACPFADEFEPFVTAERPEINARVGVQRVGEMR